MEEVDWTQEELDAMELAETDVLNGKVDLARALIKLRETDEWKLVMEQMFDQDFINTTVSNYRSFKKERRFMAEEGLMARSILRSFLDDIITDGNDSLNALRSKQEEQDAEQED